MGLRWPPQLPGKQGHRKLSGSKDFLAGQSLPSGVPGGLPSVPVAAGAQEVGLAGPIPT